MKNTYNEEIAVAEILNPVTPNDLDKMLDPILIKAEDVEKFNEVVEHNQLFEELAKLDNPVDETDTHIVCSKWVEDRDLEVLKELPTFVED